MNDLQQAPTSEPSKTAESLFGETNPVIDAALNESHSNQESTSTFDEHQLLAQQAAQAQHEEIPVVVESNAPHSTAGQEAPTQVQVQQAPAVAPVQQPPVAQPQVQQFQQQAPVQQQVAPQPTEEEVRAALGIHEVSQQDYDAIFKTESEEESRKALNALLDKKVTQAVRMANVLIQEHFGKVQQEVRPYMQFADEQRQAMWEQSFFGEHPDLAGAKPVVDAVVAQMRQQGQKFPDAKTAFNAIAQNTKAYLAQLRQLGQTAPVASNGPTQTQAVSKPSMAVLPSGGQGGAGSSAAASGKQNTAQRLFG